MAATESVVGVIAAHPDDEVLGCGGTIARLSRDGEVHILILGEGISARYQHRTDASQADVHSLQDDATEAAGLLGASSMEMAGLPDNRFDTLPLLDVIKQVERWIAAHGPTVLYTHHAGDLNIDHAITARSVLTATRPVPGCLVREVYAFEVGSSTEWSFDRFAPPFRPTMFVDISDSIETKIRAMEAYRSERRGYPHPRSAAAIRATAQRWGSVAGVSCAEAFDVVRLTR